MGFNTAFLILNDASEGLKSDPNLGQKMYDAMGETHYPHNKGGVSFSIGNHGNAGLVLPSRHADDVQLIAVGRNNMELLDVIYNVDMSDKVEVAKRLADSLGYRLVKKVK